MGLNLKRRRAQYMKLKYSKYKFSFDNEVRHVLSCDSLKDLRGPSELVTTETDQSSSWTKKWYSADLTDFLGLYRTFIKCEIYPITQLMWGRREGLLYQTKPTIRFHYVGNKAVGEFHRDRDYSHNPAEINVFLPITNAYGNNTFWIEKWEGAEDFVPVEADYGEYVLFDGANLKHGNYVNDTETTRVSFDFRILQPSKHIPGKFSVTQNKAMEIGDYWTCL